MGKRKVVGYCRVSTMEQKKKGYGIDIQIRDITICAQNHFLRVEEFYKDEAESGTEEDRKGLKRLIRDCKAGKISTIVISPSLDRLSRDVRLAENLFYDLEKLGVKILMADMPNYDRTNRRDVLIRQIKEAIAEENRKEIIERLPKGRQERVHQGRPPGGTIPYGYKRVNKGWKLNGKEAVIVRQIFSLRDNGKTTYEIAEILNQAGNRRRNGSPWTQRQVSAILSRRALYAEGLFSYGMVTGKNKSLVLLK